MPECSYNLALETKFVTLELELPDLGIPDPNLISHALQSWGEPLRWAITTINTEKRTFRLEAVVIAPQTSQLSSPLQEITKDNS